jgi:hypothetical protein
MQEKQAINVVNSMTISKRNIVQREFEKHHRENFVSTWLIDAVQKTRKKNFSGISKLANKLIFFLGCQPRLGNRGLERIKQ